MRAGSHFYNGNGNEFKPSDSTVNRATFGTHNEWPETLINAAVKESGPIKKVEACT